MEVENFNYLINYAKNLGVIKEMDPEIENINNIIENGGTVNLILNNATSFSLDFSDINSLKNHTIINIIRNMVPIIGIIDLINEAILLGIVTDVTNDYKKYDFLGYNNDYNEIVNADIFYFKINSEAFDDTIYKITFNKEKHDIKNKIEYANRTSLFIDTLIKRIMSKYNILLVRKASFSDDIIPELRLDDTIEASFSHKLDSLIETDMIENELKVLINYRDNFNNASFSENLIDDIFINFKGNEISYGFFNIGQTETEDKVFDVINDEVEAIDIDSLLRIRNLINDNKIKFNIFETLRSNENTNLYNLLKSRINEFDKEFNNDPKIEFTITPLSIYCNHIVKKSCVFNIKSKNELYKDYVVEYNIEYNPLNIKEIDYPIYGDGDIDKLKDDEELLIAYDDCCNNNELHPKITSKRFASNLYKINKYYDKDIYKYVYFLNESLVKLIDNELLPFDGNLDENTFLKSQIVRGEISGKYIYIDDAVEIDDKDILGVDLLDINKKRYISQELKRLCEVCGHMYGATDDVWNNYKNAHVLINDINRRSCCDNCKGTILNTGYAVIYSEGFKEYYLDDPKDIRYTAICPNCENKEDAFIHIGNIGNKHLGCKICKMHYCPKHMDLETNICINCNQKTLKRDIINDKSLLRNIKNALEPIDALNKELEFNINEDCNSIWVYAKRKNKTISYYFVTDENMKFVHLMAKYAKRGEE